MDLFAYAQEGERAGQGGSFGAFIPLVLMLLIILLPIYLSERKKRKLVREAIRDAGASPGGDNFEDLESSLASGHESQVEVTDEELALFVGPNAERYLSKFRKFRAQGADRFALTWNWPAFLFMPFWMIYRRL